MFPHFLVILGSIASRLFECKAKDPRDSTNKFLFAGIQGSQKEIALSSRFPEMRFFFFKQRCLNLSPVTVGVVPVLACDEL